MEKAILEWKTPEYNFEPKTNDWFLAVGIIAASFAVTAIIYNNVLFALIIFLGTATVFLYAKRPPFTVSAIISENGIRFGHNFYPFATIQSFWVETRLDHPALYIKTTRFNTPFVTIHIKGIKPERVRDVLKDTLVEEEMTEPLSQRIMEYLGF